MASIVVTNTFVSGTTILSSAMNTNFDDIETYINNRNSGSATWDRLLVTSSSAVPLIVDNSSGTSNIAQFRDNGSNVFSIADGGNVTATGVILGPAGSASAPTYSFSGDTNTGMYESAADILRLVAAGTVRMEFNSTQTLVTGGTSSAAPGFALGEVPTVGLYRVSGQDVLGIAGPVAFLAGTVTNPQITFATDLDCGIYLSAANEVTLTAGGVGSYRWNDAGDFKPINTSTATNATTGFFFITSCAGTPTGAPADSSNRVPIIFDRTNNLLYVYKPSGGWTAI